jgi:hypothetical protein
VLSETADERSAAADGPDTTGYAGRPSDLLARRLVCVSF